MSSRTQMEELLYVYAERLDSGDLDGVASLFAAATYRSDRGGHYVGKDAVADVLKRSVILYDGKPLTQHVVTNPIVAIDEAGGSATSRSRFTVLQAAPGLPLQVIVAGRYHDTFERHEGIWRFRDRLIFMDLVGDLSHHIRRNPEASRNR